MIALNGAEEFEVEALSEDDGVEEDFSVLVERLAHQDFPKG